MKVFYFLLGMIVHLSFRSVNSECNNIAEPSVKAASNDQDPAILKVVEQQFLKFMGLKSRPDKKLKRKVKVPREMWKLYYKWSNENYQDPLKNDVDTVRVLDAHDQVEADLELRRLAEGTLRFNLSAISRSERLQKAELHLFTEKYGSVFPLKGSRNVRIYSDNSSSKEKIVGIKKIPQNLIGYVKVDITNALNDWMNDSSSNNTFQVVAKQHLSKGNTHLHVRKPRSISEESWSQKKPMLYIYSSEKNLDTTKKSHLVKRDTTNQPKTVQKVAKKSMDKNRIRRSNDIGIEHMKSKKKHAKAQKETCRLRLYDLDFVKLAWDEWIIAPAGYQLNYCTGDCPRPLARYYNTTNHAVIQNSVLKTDPNRVPKLCCIPTDLRDQTFLYIDDSGKILMKQPSEMIATGCGCH